MKKNIKTIILGKRSYISRALSKEIQNVFVFSINDFLKKKIKKNSKINIIINSSYPLKKLNYLGNYNIFFNKNIFQLLKLINYINLNFKINKILFSSSASVYNSYLKKINNDDFNRQIYSSSKILLESLLNNFCSEKNIKLYILRIFNVYGINEDFSIISKILDLRSNPKKKLKIFNGGNSVRDFININDLVKIYKIFLYKNLQRGIYDIGSGKGTKIKRIIEISKVKKSNIIYEKRKISELKKSQANLDYLKKNKIHFKFSKIIDFFN